MFVYINMIGVRSKFVAVDIVLCKKYFVDLFFFYFFTVVNRHTDILLHISDIKLHPDMCNLQCILP